VQAVAHAQVGEPAPAQVGVSAVGRPARRFAGVDEVVGSDRFLAARVCIAFGQLARPAQRLPALFGVADPAKTLASPGVTDARARFYFSELGPAWSAPASSVTLVQKQAPPSAQPEKQLAKVLDQRSRQPRECRTLRTRVSS
jgi:hypothetical protein